MQATLTGKIALASEEIAEDRTDAASPVPHLSIAEGCRYVDSNGTAGGNFVAPRTYEFLTLSEHWPSFGVLPHDSAVVTNTCSKRKLGFS